MQAVSVVVKRIYRDFRMDSAEVKADWVYG
mgnify:CR=1 FL=1